MYFQKIANSCELVAIDGDTVTPYTAKENEDTMYENTSVEEENEDTMFEDTNVEEENKATMHETNDKNDIFEEDLAMQRFFDKTALFTLYELFDYELDMQ